MINVQPYIDKLEALKRFISLSVDDKLPVTFVDYEISIEMAYNPALRRNDIIAMYNQTGTFYYRGDYQHTETMRPPTFEEWYNKPPLKLS
jgi:hypothetical protein